MEQMKKNCEEMVKYSKIFLEGVDKNWSQAFLKQYESNLDIRLESVLSFKNYQQEYNILKNTCGLQEAKIYEKAYEVFTQKQKGVYIPKLKEKPKPKPSSKSKPKKPEEIKVQSVKDGILTTKQYGEISDLTGEQIYNNLKSNASPIFYPWSSQITSSFITYGYILNNNSNDCSLSETILRDINSSRGNSKIVNPNKNMIDYAKLIAENIYRCYKRNKVVCIPFGIVQREGNSYSHHANMLIFNYHRKEAEHFEPHGEFFKGGFNKKGERKKVQGVNLEPAIKKINAELDKIQGAPWPFEYVPPKDVCPAGFNKLKGFQSLDSYKDKSTSKRDFQGVVITEIGGYCKMWSFFYMDLRLKTLRKKASEIYTEMATMFQKDYSDEKRKEFIYLMRGMSKFAWEKQLEMVKKGFITEPELIKYLGTRKRSELSNELIIKYLDATKKLMLDDWVRFLR